MTPESRTLTQTIHHLAPIGLALVDAASHLAYMHELLPKRGELNYEFEQLVQIIARIDQRYEAANEALLAAVMQIEHDKLVPTPLPLRGEAA